MGIEPTSSAWEAEVLPLNYTRLSRLTFYAVSRGCQNFSRSAASGDALNYQAPRSSTSATPMQVIVNGEAQDLPEGTTALELVRRLGLEGRRLAMEVNQEILPRSQFETRALRAGDRVEIVHAIGGG